MVVENETWCRPRLDEPLNRCGWHFVESRSVDANLMDLAYQLALNSEALDGHMGCCVARGSEVIVEAINAPLFGEGRSDVHAEAAAICYAARRGLSLEGAALYVTRAPCGRCYRLIAFAGIGKIVAPNTMDDAEMQSASVLGIDFVVLKDDDERAAWRKHLRDRHLDHAAVKLARDRRKILRQRKSNRRLNPSCSQRSLPSRENCGDDTNLSSALLSSLVVGGDGLGSELSADDLAASPLSS